MFWLRNKKKNSITHSYLEAWIIFFISSQKIWDSLELMILTAYAQNFPTDLSSGNRNLIFSILCVCATKALSDQTVHMHRLA